MKTFIITSASVLFIGFTGFTQDLRYEIHGRYSRAVKKENLSGVKQISDFIPGYPANWITDYVSVEILTTCNGIAMKGLSANDILSTEQKDILNKADLAADIIVDVKYKYANLATGNVENNKTHIVLTVVPEIEAEFAGGHRQMIKYLEENAIHKISESGRPGLQNFSGSRQVTPKKLQQGIVRFTVNEGGDIINAKTLKTTEDPATDRLLLETINKMPKWKPAENSKGVKVKQEFEFSVGSNGGC